MKDREEIKMLLRDWMTSQTQLMKVHNRTLSSADIAFVWRSSLGIKMNEEWIDKALYGCKKEVI